MKTIPHQSPNLFQGITNAVHALWKMVIFLLLFIACDATAQDTPSAGQAIMSIGSVQAVQPYQAGRALKRGDSFFTKDTISVGTSSKTQLRFMDGTLMNLIASTEFKVDSYVFNQPDQKSESLSTLVKGGFRAISGSIAKENSAGTNVKTPIATIGLRGTIYEALLANCKLLVGCDEGKVLVDNDYGSLEIGPASHTRYAIVEEGQAPMPSSEKPAELAAVSFDFEGGLPIGPRPAGTRTPLPTPAPTPLPVPPSGSTPSPGPTPTPPPAGKKAPPPSITRTKIPPPASKVTPPSVTTQQTPGQPPSTTVVTPPPPPPVQQQLVPPPPPPPVQQQLLPPPPPVQQQQLPPPPQPPGQKQPPPPPTQTSPPPTQTPPHQKQTSPPPTQTSPPPTQTSPPPTQTSPPPTQTPHPTQTPPPPTQTPSHPTPPPPPPPPGQNPGTNPPTPTTTGTPPAPAHPAAPAPKASPSAKIKEEARPQVNNEIKPTVPTSGTAPAPKVPPSAKLKEKEKAPQRILNPEEVGPAAHIIESQPPVYNELSLEAIPYDPNDPGVAYEGAHRAAYVAPAVVAISTVSVIAIIAIAGQFTHHDSSSGSSSSNSYSGSRSGSFSCHCQ